MPRSDPRELRRLAQLYNVQTFHYDGLGRLRQPPPEALLLILRALGAHAERMEDLVDGIRARRQFLWRRAIEPVVVAWDGRGRLTLRLPSNLAEKPIRYQIRLEHGEIMEGTLNRAAGSRPRASEVDGVRYVAHRVELPPGVPSGYHRLRLQIEEKCLDTLLISAPLQAYAPPRSASKSWGIFLPLYALQSQTSWGSGDFSDLAALADWTTGLGGRVVGTLPLLPAFLDEPFDPSPYSPVSRRAWNELYVDVTRLPEFERSAEARAIVNSDDFQNELEALRGQSLVDYRQHMALKRKVLAELARSLATGGPQRRDTLRSFTESHPHLEDYARFRATVERERRPWSQWPETHRERLDANAYDEAVKEYYLYAQWAAHDQIRRAAEKSRTTGGALYLDFPLGVNRDGYDTWREKRLFALGMGGGAPPDPFFTQGQNWGFPPLHPERQREDGYRYFIASLRHHLQCAGMLRIDHVMGLHRLFWIPDGHEASEGEYVHYPAEELYAVLSLESHRHQARIVGENLGTVPFYVNRAMESHAIRGMHVGQFSVHPDPRQALPEVPAETVASLNTHDTPTFAGFWAGDDVQDRIELGILDEPGAAQEFRNRCGQRESLVAFLKRSGRLIEAAPNASAVLTAWLNYLASGETDLLLVNLEDLWLEKLPQNVPGTWQERPNWRRKARYRFEDFCRTDSVLNALKAIDDQRKHSR